jgi:N6-L-threonylcarbamoyladenine synthase
MNILSIETSCDETAAAIIQWAGGTASVLANVVSSQASLHAKWGGVVPDLASREHIKNIVPVIEETLERAQMTPDDIDLIAVTEGPGLMPALLIGVSAARTLALVWKKPLIGINHLEGHIYANFVGNDQKKAFPLTALIVSGGHTQLMLMQDHFQYELLGETQDDAAGEAFDKVAKMLGLPYPGGPIVAKRADTYRNDHLQSATLFPRPMLDAHNFDFSFSGLKTSVLYFLKKHEEEKKDEAFIDMVCHEFQEAVIDVLVGKTKKALELHPAKTFVIAGGVSANERLRNRLRTLIEERFPDTRFLTPEFIYSLDNAAMIGIAAAYRYERMSAEERSALMATHLTLDPDANLPLK